MTIQKNGNIRYTEQVCIGPIESLKVAHAITIIYYFPSTKKELKTYNDAKIQSSRTCRRAHVLFTLFVFVCVKWCDFNFVCLCPVSCVPNVAIFLNCQFFFIAPYKFGVL
jgi:hypothetical protein